MPERYQERLQHAQQAERGGQDQGNPEHEMQPDGRLVSDFNQERRRNDEDSDDEDDENRGTVSCVMVAQVQAAVTAGLVDVQISRVELPLPAAGTAAAESGAEWGNSTRDI